MQVRVVVAIVLVAGAIFVLRERARAPGQLAPDAPHAEAAIREARPAANAPVQQHGSSLERRRAAPLADAVAEPDGGRFAEAEPDTGVPLLDDQEQGRAADMTRTAVARALAIGDRGALHMLLATVEARADDQLLSFADTDALEAAVGCLDARAGARAKAMATIAARPSSFDAQVRAACADAP